MTMKDVYKRQAIIAVSVIIVVIEIIIFKRKKWL